MTTQNTFLNQSYAKHDLKAAVLGAIQELPEQFTLTDVMEKMSSKRKSYIGRSQVEKYLNKLVDRHQWLTTLRNCRGDGESYYRTYEIVPMLVFPE